MHSGGYDDRLPDNTKTLQQLKDLATSLQLQHATPDSTIASIASVLFILNLTEDQKLFLLHRPETIALLYTPANEHFGIVPVEAMACGLPVLACDSGGPLETIVEASTSSDSKAATGILRRPDAEEWSFALLSLASLSEEAREDCARAGKARVREVFSLEVMAKQLEAALQKAYLADGKEPIWKENGAVVVSWLALEADACRLHRHIALVLCDWHEYRHGSTPDHSRVLLLKSSNHHFA